MPYFLLAINLLTFTAFSSAHAAIPLEKGVPVTVSGDIGGPGNVFSIHVPAGSRIRIDLTGARGALFRADMEGQSSYNYNGVHCREIVWEHSAGCTLYAREATRTIVTITGFNGKYEDAEILASWQPYTPRTLAGFQDECGDNGIPAKLRGTYDWFREAYGTDCQGLEEILAWQTGVVIGDPFVESDLDISLLRFFPGISQVFAYTSGIEDISALSGLEELEIFMAPFQEIRDLSPLAGKKHLRIVELRENQISSAEVFSGLQSLEILGLSDNHLTTGVFKDLPELRALNIGGNPLTGALVLSETPRLRSLFSEEGFLEQILTDDLYSLEELFLWNNRLTDIGFISLTPALQELDLGDNHIVDIGELPSLEFLTGLDIRNNLITDLSPLAGMALQPNPAGLRGNPVIEDGDHCPLEDAEDWIIGFCRGLLLSGDVGKSIPPGHAFRDGAGVHPEGHRFQMGVAIQVMSFDPESGDAE